MIFSPSPQPVRVQEKDSCWCNSLLDIFLQGNKNWNSVYLLQITNESIKLSREITQEKKKHPPRNQIMFGTVTGSDKLQPVKLQKFIVHWRAANYGPVAALPRLSCMCSPWLLKCTLCIPGLGLRQNLLLKKRQCKHACPERCHARNGMLLWKLLFNTWARSGAACPNNLLTGQHFHSQHCRVNASQASEYFMFTYDLAFAWIRPKRSSNSSLG